MTEIAGHRQGEWDKAETRAEAAEAEAAALREAGQGVLSLVEFYAERDMKSPANHQEFVRETQEKVATFRKALSAAPEPRKDAK